MLVQEPVQSAVWHCLNNYAFADATFIAERLFAETGSEECLSLVATCYYRAGNLNQAYHTLKTHGLRTSSTKYLFAKCAVELEKDFEAESVLNGNLIDPRKELSVDELTAEFGDKASFALQLLSGIYHRTERRIKAIEADKKALRLNPFLWSSFESLCNKGEFVSPDKIFDLEHVDNLAHCQGVNPLVNLVNSNINSLKESADFLESGPRVQHTPQQIPSTPQQLPATPYQPVIGTPLNLPTFNITDISLNVSTPRQNLMETPLLNWNSVSTPLTGMGPQISGISLLNLTSESDISRPLGLMPPPLRPKLKVDRQSVVGSAHGGYSPSFGALFGSPAAGGGGFTARILEFSSPQIAILSPAESPLKRKPSLTLGNSPMPPPSRASTPSAPVLSDELRNNKRVAMAAKPENQKQSVLGQSGNVITPQNSLPTRRSSRLFGSTQSVKENSKGLNKNRISTKSPSRKPKQRLPRGEKQLSELEKNEKNKPGLENIINSEKLLESDTKPEKPKPAVRSVLVNLSVEATKLQKSSAVGLMSLLRSLGLVLLEATRYNSREAVRLLDDIPEHHAESSWALAVRGKCHFELSEYKEAVQLFKVLREKDPFRLEMMEYYSTALWHLQDDIELSALAQDLTERNRLDAVSWCAAGNCFSHQKEHETAIRFFQRAVQVKPRFAYAYTLLGHEYVIVEELEKALGAFRTALRIDSRHYNAWYGIGLTYFKQERFQLAEFYYKKALAINPYSPILMCHVAVVQHSLQKTERALNTLNTAIIIAPKNALCKFERASILHSSERYVDALKELNDLKDIVPKESPVYFLLGKVHKKLGNTHLALMHFSWAMDLDPKGANSQIKDALDPALNRTGQESELEDESRDDLDSRNQNTEDQSGLMGEDSVFGENYSGTGQQPGSSMVLNESDDSL